MVGASCLTIPPYTNRERERERERGWGRQATSSSSSKEVSARKFEMEGSGRRHVMHLLLRAAATAAANASTARIWCRDGKLSTRTQASSSRLD